MNRQARDAKEGQKKRKPAAGHNGFSFFSRFPCLLLFFLGVLRLGGSFFPNPLANHCQSAELTATPIGLSRYNIPICLPNTEP